MQAGERIAGNLRLVRQLGQGGMGSVWVADHLALGTQVAVKFMSRTFAEHPQFVERFRREAAAAAQLKNPHVAQVFDHGLTTDGSPFIVMELLEGEDLGKRIKREGPLPFPLVAEILWQAAKALGKAHQLGIVHRDIKADNLFLTDLEGEVFVKVLDFGIAKVSSDSAVSMTSTGGTIGTPLYMSPEQLLSAKHVDHRADIWSLGVVAYHALTQQLPFPGDTVGAISVAVHAGVFRPPSSLRPDLPGGIDTWFQRVFRRNPDERFSSVREMAEAFRQAIHAPAAPPGPLPVAVPQPPDSSDTQETLPLGAPARGVVDTSPRTLDGKSVTIGSRPGRAPRVLGILAGLTIVGLIVGVALLQPWKGAVSGAGADPTTPSATLEAPQPATTTLAPASASSEEPAAASATAAEPTATASPSGAPDAGFGARGPSRPKPGSAQTTSATVRPPSQPSAAPKPSTSRPRPAGTTDGDPGF